MDHFFSLSLCLLYWFELLAINVVEKCKLTRTRANEQASHTHSFIHSAGLKLHQFNLSS